MLPRPRAVSGSRTALQARALPRDRACRRPHRSLQAPILSVAWIPDWFTSPPRLACRPLPCSLPPIPSWQASRAPAGTPAILAETELCLRPNRSSPPPAGSCAAFRPDPSEHRGSCQGTLHADRYRCLAAAPAAVVVTGPALPLVQRMKASYPEATILLTHMTASGRAAGRELFGDGVVQAWLPYDVPFAVNRFLANFRPAAGFLVETELWPNLIGEAHRQDVPVFLVNARMSERSAESYARFSSLTRPMLRRLRGVAAQSPADATLLADVGSTEPIVTRKLKHDVSMPA